MLRFGPDRGPVAIAALPLFEEANRTRAFVVAILRGLAERGIGSVVPDLPGQGDSLVPLETVTIAAMRAAYAGLAGGLAAEGLACHGIGIRSGALLDTAAQIAGRWHLAPQDGPGLARELMRIRQMEGGSRIDNSLSDFAEDSRQLVEVAGNLLAPGLVIELDTLEAAAVPGVPHRIVRYASDPAAADRRIAGAPLWRRAEPDVDPMLSRLLADDIADWIASCGA